MPIFTHHPLYTIPKDEFGDFGSLLRFIDDLNKPLPRQTGRTGFQFRQFRRPTPTFTPRFDVRETEKNYELHGELPGIEKKDINIEFSDLRTVVIRGNVERNYTQSNASQATSDNTKRNGAIVNKPDTEDSSETRSNKSYQATVEDDYESIDFTPASTIVETTAPAPAPAPAPAEKAPQPENAGETQPKPKYWVSERSIGNFSRSFTFAGHVDHDNVTASLNNGILTIIIPKAKPETRRVFVQ
ncbi:30 kDa heat shock protein [Xylaria nigripes]|nr:30 kDa heat shock protein [Xylaria nigripes]